MSEFKGTKGEWEAKSLTIMSNEKKVIANCNIMTFEHDRVGKRIEDKLGLNNAKLIACAPEMLEMLIKLNNLCTMKIEDRNELEELIKKSTCQ